MNYIELSEKVKEFKRKPFSDTAKNVILDNADQIAEALFVVNSIYSEGIKDDNNLMKSTEKNLNKAIDLLKTIRDDLAFKAPEQRNTCMDIWLVKITVLLKTIDKT